MKTLIETCFEAAQSIGASDYAADIAASVACGRMNRNEALQLIGDDSRTYEILDAADAAFQQGGVV